MSREYHGKPTLALNLIEISPLNNITLHQQEIIPLPIPLDTVNDSSLTAAARDQVGSWLADRHLQEGQPPQFQILKHNIIATVVACAFGKPLAQPRTFKGIIHCIIDEGDQPCFPGGQTTIELGKPPAFFARENPPYRTVAQQIQPILETRQLKTAAELVFYPFKSCIQILVVANQVGYSHTFPL